MSASPPPSDATGPDLTGGAAEPSTARSESLRTELAALSAILPAVPGGGSEGDLLAALQTALGGAYALERELGGGGMSRVFVATETALDRRVAVKVLAPELLQGVSAERFAREVALAARLQDPHIVPVLTTGATADGVPYYTMPFIEGESLRERLRRGPVPLDEALRILRDVAEALEYAHARGIVHRDIKPENVLLSGRNAVVADFGIAKAMSAARASVPNGTLTSIGLSLGTPAYMAPEQAAGDAVDHRVDLYAWGMMAWELLAGRHPFAPRTQGAQLMAAQLTEMPAPLDTVRPGLPPALGALVMACVAKAPEARPADAATLLAALGGATTDLAITSGRRAPVAAPVRARRRTVLALGAAAVVALGAGGAWMAQRGGTTGGAGDAGAASSLAVLPFEHQGDSADAYLTAGITDEIRNKLTGVPNLVVIARASSMQYTGKNTPPQEIAKELGVRWLLTGTVQVVGSGDQRRVLVRPELVEATADGRLQSKGGTPFDGPLTDVVKAQGEVAGQVVTSMEVAVGGSDRAKLVEVPTTDAEAYDLFLRGMAVVAGGAANDPASLARGLAFFEQAVARDSTLVAANMRLAYAATLLYSNGTPSPALATKARAAIARLERLAPGSADALRARALVRRIFDRDLQGSLADLERARRVSPSDQAVIGNLASIKADIGRFDDALADYDAAIRLDPRTSITHSSRARLLLRMRRHDEARQSAERARALAPMALSPLMLRIGVEAAAGDLAAARRAFDGAAADIPLDRRLAHIGAFYELWWVASPEEQKRLTEVGADAYGGVAVALPTVRSQLHAALGDPGRSRMWADSAVRLFTAQLQETPRDVQSHVFLGLMHAYAGRRTEALAAARRGLALDEENTSARMTSTAGYVRLVAAHAALLAGNRAQAIAWVRDGLARRPMQNAAWVRLDPAFATLRGDPTFERVLAEAP
jgi:serine/threonine-protein kinase